MNFDTLCALACTAAYAAVVLLVVWHVIGQWFYERKVMRETLARREQIRRIMAGWPGEKDEE